VWVPDHLPRLDMTHVFAPVRLPLHLSRSAPGRVFDLGSRADRARVYEIVLQEGRPADILAYVDGALLVDLWDDPRPAANPKVRALSARNGHLTRDIRGLEDFMPLSWRPRMGETWGAHADEAPIIANGRVRGALPGAKGSLVPLMTVCLADDGIIRRNPCRIKGAGQEQSAERPVLTIAEVYDLAAAIDPRYRALVLLGTFASLRWAELAALRPLRHRHGHLHDPGSPSAHRAARRRISVRAPQVQGRTARRAILRHHQG
jgi:integrase